MTDLLPPNASRFERGMARTGDRLAAIDYDPAALWNPDTCPIALLPWLAWTLHTDHWDPAWSDARKRVAVASAIDDHRHRGTRLSMERVLASFDELLSLTEWFEATPRRDPYTFEVRLNLIDAAGVAGGERTSAAFAEAIIAEVTRAKPVRAAFEFVAALSMEAAALPLAAAQATGYRRIDVDATIPADTSQPWVDLLQDENGEPLTDDFGGYLDGTP